MQTSFDSNVEYPPNYTPIDLFTQTPYKLLVDWILSAKNLDIPDYNAMVLSSCTTQNLPNSRVVLAKQINDDSILFFSHYRSPKGKEITHQKNVSALFYWHTLHKQIRCWGTCSPLPSQDSQRYFDSRSRSAQLGSWASHQSNVIKSPQNSLSWEQILQPWEEKFPSLIPKPPHWGGFSIQLHTIEFWQGIKNRFNYRVLFKKSNLSWQQGELLYP